MSLVIYTANVQAEGRPPHDRARPYTLEPGVRLFEIDVPTQPTPADARTESRRIKIKEPPTIAPDDILMWLDASLRPRPGLLTAVAKWLAHHDLAIFIHPWRDCAYDEVDECVRRKKLDARQGAEIKSMLALNSLPKHWGLWACGCVVAKPGLERLRDSWWHWAQATGMRDQIALPLALRESGYRDKLFTVQGSIYEFFDWVPHGR